jgi:hypothetical protein
MLQKWKSLVHKFASVFKTIKEPIVHIIFCESILNLVNISTILVRKFSLEKVSVGDSYYKSLTNTQKA